MLRDADMIYEGVLGENYRAGGSISKRNGDEERASLLCLGAMISYPLKL